jgi:hypothetical protein
MMNAGEAGMSAPLPDGNCVEVERMAVAGQCGQSDIQEY